MNAPLTSLLQNHGPGVILHHSQQQILQRSQEHFQTYQVRIHSQTHGMNEHIQYKRAFTDACWTAYESQLPTFEAIRQSVQMGKTSRHTVDAFAVPTKCPYIIG